MLPTKIEFGRYTDFQRKTGGKLDFNHQKIVLLEWIGILNHQISAGPGPNVSPSSHTAALAFVPSVTTIYVVLDADTGADLGSMNDRTAPWPAEKEIN